MKTREQYLDEVRTRVMPTLKVSGYWAAEGSKVVLRLKIQARGFKRKTVHHAGMAHLAGDVVNLVFVPDAREIEKNGEIETNQERAERNQAQTDMSKDPYLRSLLDAATASADGRREAEAQAFANRQRAQSASRRHALVRLSEQMRGHDYTREDVLAAWEISQVEKVMAS